MPTSAILFLVALAICLAIDVAGVMAAVRLWRARPSGARMGKSTATYLVLTIVIVVIVAGAMLNAVLSATGVIGGESFDPSQKARVLAEGISELLNTAAFATLVATPWAIAVLIYARLRRSSDPQRR